ncbi:unnamed protein product [Chrysodeixis includens]|uniref:Uncharacterized protein n=1 Tax=Chrysodeixis includens TaxID=689277 RepID=A0A9P0BQK4_CHRIL|nr:unnamed protein product [Chrysodeixis includens]
MSRTGGQLRVGLCCVDRLTCELHGSSNMTNQFSDDDEDYCDDPIKLFDSCEDAVYFGSKVYERSATTIDFTSKAENTPSNAECRSIEDRSGVSSDLLRQLSVKLVDCGQFPWYYRKYSQQILDLTGVDLDSDSDVDVEKVDGDENDYIVVEGLKNVNVMNSMESVLTAMRLSTGEKRRNTIRLKEEMEIEKALSQRNTVKVDFKRNQGLVGMKIKNLPVLINFKNKEGRKQGFKLSEKRTSNVFEHAAKALEQVGTEIIPVIEHKDDNCHSHELSSVSDKIEASINTKANEESPCKVKAGTTAQKNINRICEQLLNKKSTRISEVSNTSTQNDVIEINIISSPKPRDEVSKAKTVPSVPSGKSKKTVKDVTKTNKFKNEQIKKRNKALLELLTSNPNVHQTEVPNKCDQNQTENSINNGHQNSDDKSKSEINSPILPSSHSSMKSKNRRNFLKCNESFDLLGDKTEKRDPHSSETAKPLNNSGNSTEGSSMLKDFIISPVHDLTPRKMQEKDVNNKNDGTGMNNPISQQNSQESAVKSQKDSVAVIKKHTSADSRKKIVVAKQKAVDADNLNTKNTRKNDTDISGIASNENISLTKETKNKNGYSMTTYVATFEVPCHSYKPTEAPKANLSNPNTLLNSKNVPSNPNKSFERNTFPMASNVSQIPNIQNAPYVNHVPGQYQAENYQRTNIMRKPMHVTVHSQPLCSHYQKSRMPYNSDLPLRYSKFIPMPGTGKPYFPFCRGSAYPRRIPAQRQNIHNERLPLNIPPLMSLSPQVPHRNTRDGNQVPQYFNSSFHSTIPITQTAPIMPEPINQPYTNNYKTNKHPGNVNVKKTNVNLVPNKDDTNNSKQKLEEMNEKKTITDKPSVSAEVVGTKTEMLKELDKLSFDDVPKNDLKGKSSNDVCEIKKPCRIESIDKSSRTTKADETVKTPVSNKNELQTKYSPPILPIPRYDHVLDHIVSDPRTRIDKPITTVDKTLKQKVTNEIKPAPNTVKRCRKRISHEFKEPSCSRRKCDGKKISLEEYKQRVYVKSLSELSKKPGKDNANAKKYKCGPGPRMRKKHPNHTPESDLGYDSDSTVVL